jgi:hypothetical protein
MIGKFFRKFKLKDKDVYCFQINEDNIVTSKIVFNEKNSGKTVEQWIKDSGERWFVSEVKVSGQYYPFHGESFTADVKPKFKNPELWHIDVEKKSWIPIDYPYPNDGEYYEYFCEDCLKWIKSPCC